MGVLLCVCPLSLVGRSVVGRPVLDTMPSHHSTRSYARAAREAELNGLTSHDAWEDSDDHYHGSERVVQRSQGSASHVRTQQAAAAHRGLAKTEHLQSAD